MTPALLCLKSWSTVLPCFALNWRLAFNLRVAKTVVK